MLSSLAKSLAIQMSSKWRRQCRVCQRRRIEKNIHLQTTDAVVHPAMSRFTQLAESKVQIKTKTAKQNYSGSNRWFQTWSCPQTVPRCPNPSQIFYCGAMLWALSGLFIQGSSGGDEFQQLGRVRLERQMRHWAAPGFSSLGFTRTKASFRER